jgi:hypothetical protein
MPKIFAVEKSNDQLSARYRRINICSKFLEHSDCLRMILSTSLPLEACGNHSQTQEIGSDIGPHHRRQLVL